MDILLLHRQGFSQRQIARRLGISRVTVKKYLDNPQACLRFSRGRSRGSMLDAYAGHIEAWLSEDLCYRATLIYDRLCALGFTGGYDIVRRRVKAMRRERTRIAYMRFETEPGFQAQVDFGEFAVERADGAVDRYYLFSMILGYSRRLYAEFVEKCDLPTFLDCHMRAFEYFGGVPAEILYDRMKNAYIGRLAGKARFNDSLTGFALHYGFRPTVAPAYAPFVKGKVERPYDFIREGFWRGYGFGSVKRANADLLAWLGGKDERVHGTTHEVVRERFERERPHLSSLPRLPFDTSYRLCRKVNKDCTVRFEGNNYVVPHNLVGAQVVLRVKDGRLRIFADDRLVVTYSIPDGKGRLVQQKRFYEALRRDAEMNRRKYGHSKRFKGRAKGTVSPTKPLYDLDVEVRPLSAYDAYAGEERP